MSPIQDTGGELRALLRVLRRRFVLIAIAVVAALGGALLFVSSQPKQYTGTSVLLFKPLLLDAQLTGLPLQVPANDPTVESATDVGLVSLPQVRVEAARILGHPYTSSSLKKDVTATASGKSTLVDVQGTASTPAAAARIANAMTTAFIDVRRQQLVGDINGAIRNLRNQLHRTGQTALQRAVLRNSLVKLAESKAVQPGDVELAGAAVPPNSPSSPKKILDLVLGGALGLVLGLALALLVEQLDRRVRRVEEVGEMLDVPVLGSIPRSRELKSRTAFARELSPADIEAFRLLRTNLRYRSGGRAIRSVVVTSAASGSGKTTIALHLAATAAAATDGKVLLLEADLRRPRLSELLDLPPGEGLSTALKTSQNLADAVVTIPAARLASTNGNGSHRADGSQPEISESVRASFDVLLAGPFTPDSSELLSSQHMTELLDQAVKSYDLVIVDGPPPGLVSDAIPLLKQVDAVVLIARLGYEHSPELKELRTQLRGLGVRPLGVVANYARRSSNKYVYGRRNPYVFAGRRNPYVTSGRR